MTKSHPELVSESHLQDAEKVQHNVLCGIYMKKVLVLGCTGSIGTSTLDIINNQSDEFCVCGLQANSNKDKLLKLSSEYKCPSLLTSENNSAQAFQKLIEEAKPDIVVNGIAGAAGLLPSKIVLENGIDLALANKETIVMAGPLIKELARNKGAQLLPVDSEHSAIFNLTQRIGMKNISKIVITASGGPFRNYTKEELENVTLEQALKHPTWNMGKKITIDSSTLANKGLEVIEAAFLFDVTADQIEVVVHPQSLIHSLVRTNDGELYAQISEPDMKHPILCALNWPDNKPSYMQQFDLFEHTMTFFKPRMDDFPLLSYAFECVKAGNSYPIAFNAANEVAVHAFIDGKINYPAISKIVRKVLDSDWQAKLNSFEEVFEADKKARKLAAELI